jgi:hypothetical protein
MAVASALPQAVTRIEKTIKISSTFRVGMGFSLFGLVMVIPAVFPRVLVKNVDYQAGHQRRA